jgi:hypothetical protein
VVLGKVSVPADQGLAGQDPVVGALAVHDRAGVRPAEGGAT